MIEYTFVIIKPDAVRRNLENTFFEILRKNHLHLFALQRGVIQEKYIIELYSQHNAQPWFQELVNYMTGGICICALFEGRNAISRAISTIGSTDPMEADPNSIRGLWGISRDFNSIHRSDSQASFIKEKNIFFPTLSLL
jgi:nucleoside-diphosphate kinase